MLWHRKTDSTSSTFFPTRKAFGNRQKPFCLHYLRNASLQHNCNLKTTLTFINNFY